MGRISLWDIFNNDFFSEDIYHVEDRRNYRRKDNVEKHFKSGALHRENGPAVVYLDKSKEDEWWLEGAKVTEEEVKKYRSEKEASREHIVYLRSGTPYKITGKQLQEVEKILGI